MWSEEQFHSNYIHKVTLYLQPWLCRLLTQSLSSTSRGGTLSLCVCVWVKVLPMIAACWSPQSIIGGLLAGCHHILQLKWQRRQTAFISGNSTELQASAVTQVSYCRSRSRSSVWSNSHHLQTWPGLLSLIILLHELQEVTLERWLHGQTHWAGCCTPHLLEMNQKK